MNNFIFQNSTSIYFGRGCVKEYLSFLTKGHDTLFLAYAEGTVKDNGIYDQVISILKHAGKTVVEFPDIMKNPTYSKVLEGARLVRESGVDMILGMGGCGVMDCCRAISLASGYRGDVWNDFWERPGVIEFDPLPLGAIATTVGAGSTCSGRAVITNEEKKLRTGRDYPQLNPPFCAYGSRLHL